ncbi:DUF192 domain-containing protein [Candidatus Peregrinibacteria bacterium]|nr:DUF192 domain-containing protein [Candidatus Peregrinibacteria bacterium]
MNKLRILILVFPFILFTACTLSSDVIKIVTSDGTYKFKVETVTTEEDKRQGLMGRESLSDDTGMLFVYQEPARQSFWMKNMVIPLDILFISPDFKINHIY